MRALRDKLQWYTWIIIVGLLLFSLLCWASNIRLVIIQQLQRSHKTELERDAIGEKHINQTKDSLGNKVESFMQLTDDAIKRADTFWCSGIVKKSRLCKIDTILTYFANRQISSSQVEKGINGWLFYKTTIDGNPIADYEGTNCYTDTELATMLQETLKIQSGFNNKGIEFALCIPPNKETVYSEYMPDKYKRAEMSRTDRLAEYLEDGGVNVISPKRDLICNKNDTQLYYTYDTHWNQAGAYIAVCKTLSGWGIEMPDLSKRKIQEFDLKGHYHYCGNCDLAAMVGLRFIFNDDKEYIVEGTGKMDWDRYASEQGSGKITCFENDRPIVKATVLLVGDSYRSSMIPALSEAFSKVYVVHRDCYRPSMIEDVKPDYVIAEYVERYSDAIQNISLLLK